MLEIPLEWWRFSQHPRTSMIAIGLAGINLGYFVLGVLGLLRWRQSGWGPHLPLVAAMVGFVVLRCALLLTIDNSEPRYTLEFFPLLILWGSFLFRSQKRSV
jgi:hypothetical protein